MQKKLNPKERVFPDYRAFTGTLFRYSHTELEGNEPFFDVYATLAVMADNPPWYREGMRFVLRIYRLFGTEDTYGLEFFSENPHSPYHDLDEYSVHETEVRYIVKEYMEERSEFLKSNPSKSNSHISGK